MFSVCCVRGLQVDPVANALAHHVRDKTFDRELQTSDLADIATALAQLQHR
jgi:hypothetical protein